MIPGAAGNGGHLPRSSVIREHEAKRFISRNAQRDFGLDDFLDLHSFT